jgi:uncharacterized repeat protein (TIGR01451 family)
MTAATADPDLADNVTASTIAVTQVAAITVTITDTPDPVAPNGTITYVIDVMNAGPSFGSNIPFGVALAPELTLVSLSPPGGTIASLPIGTQRYTLTANVNSTPGATITTTATAGTASASAMTDVSSPSAVSIVKSVAGAAFFVTQPVTYLITITNNGTSAQFDNAGDEMIDVLPGALTLTNATATAGTVTTSGNTVRWNGAIAPGASVTLTITATIGAPGAITNQATIHFDADGNGTNESQASSNAVTIPARPAAAIPAASTWVLTALICALAVAGWMRS